MLYTRKAIVIKSFALFIVLLIVVFPAAAKRRNTIKKPKIVVGIVVDQMRWDYLYRYNAQYKEGGFKRLMRDGYNCQNTMIDYLPSYTAPGHSCIYTGSVPSIHGIAGNTWIDNRTGRGWYCVEDTSVYLAGDELKKTSMSPRNLLTTTITDELRLATNFRSRVYGVALKDRSSILPAGHLANAAYWYNDKTASFVTSTYYNREDQNPAWLQAFNNRHEVDRLVKQNWNLLYDTCVYKGQCTADANKYEAAFNGEQSPEFPHVFDKLSAWERNNIIRCTPAGNTYTLMMAQACMDSNQLGMGEETDFMAISLSSSDYVGHRFGTNSIEVEDMYLRLDIDIANFLKYMDDKYGDGNYLLFLTADHGGAHNASFLHDKEVPSGVLDAHLMKDINTNLAKRFGRDSIVVMIDNNQLYLNNKLIENSKFDVAKIKEFIMEKLNKMPEILYVIDMEHMDRTPVPEHIRNMIVNGYNKDRSGAISIILNAGWYDDEGRLTGTTHGGWNPYDTHIPLLWYGCNVSHGECYRTLEMKDISATLATMLHIQMPNGCIGTPIVELVKRVD
ncbi:MAG: type phosphodiesterase/nucleotide pyrophosphatase [Flavipsychrobacter sp.]|nr:type phosphodiesterase/nucleotide pyrophosphatase [Flavipsychrobacter sp.]